MSAIVTLAPAKQRTGTFATEGLGWARRRIPQCPPHVDSRRPIVGDERLLGAANDRKCARVSSRQPPSILSISEKRPAATIHGSFPAPAAAVRKRWQGLPKTSLTALTDHPFCLGPVMAVTALASRRTQLLRPMGLSGSDAGRRASEQRMSKPVHGTLTLLDLAGAVAQLLWGVHMAQSGVQRAFGSEFRRILSRGFGGRLQAFVAGLGVTAVLQSSTATALMIPTKSTAGLKESSLSRSRRRDRAERPALRSKADEARSRTLVRGGTRDRGNLPGGTEQS
jgi:Na+/Pi-cotransporter